MIPHTLVLEPELRVFKVYNGYWFFGRPTVEELRLDLRAVLQRCRPDWDISGAEQRAAWARGDRAGFYLVRTDAGAAAGRRGLIGKSGLTRLIARRSIDAWNSAAHWTNVAAQLAAVVNDVEQGNPQQPSHRVLEKDLFRSLNQPRRVIPTRVIQAAQLLAKSVVITLIGLDHLFQAATIRGLPAQTAVHALLALTELDAALFGRNHQTNQLSGRS